MDKKWRAGDCSKRVVSVSGVIPVLGPERSIYQRWPAGWGPLPRQPGQLGRAAGRGPGAPSAIGSLAERQLATDICSICKCAPPLVPSGGTGEKIKMFSVVGR